MLQKIAMSVFEVVGSPLCVASSDGQKVYVRLAAALKEGQEVVISFRNVKILTSAFLNTAIGQLYGKFSEGQIRSLLDIADMEQGDMVLLQHVVKTAKRYFDDPERFKRELAEAKEESGVA